MIYDINIKYKEENMKYYVTVNSQFVGTHYDVLEAMNQVDREIEHRGTDAEPIMDRIRKIIPEDDTITEITINNKRFLTEEEIKQKIDDIDEELKSWYDRTTADWVLNKFKELFGGEDE